jgi:hypothetical protein
MREPIPVCGGGGAVTGSDHNGLCSVLASTNPHTEGAVEEVDTIGLGLDHQRVDAGVHGANGRGRIADDDHVVNPLVCGSEFHAGIIHAGRA